MKHRMLSRSLAVVALLAACAISLAGVQPAQAGNPQMPGRAGWKAGSSNTVSAGRAAHLGESDNIAGLDTVDVAGYSIAQIRKIGDPAPGGGNHIIDFELQDLADNGDILYESEVSDSNGDFLGEAVYLHTKHSDIKLVRPGDPAPLCPRPGQCRFCHHQRHGGWH